MKAIKYFVVGAMISITAPAVAQDIEYGKALVPISQALKADPNNADAAKDLVKSYMKEYKKDPEALVALGSTFLGVKNYSKAEEIANLVIEKNKKNAKAQAEAYILLGDAEAMKDATGNGGGAASHYATAMSLDPKNPSGYTRYASVYRKINPKLVEETYAKLRAEIPDYPIEAEAGYAGTAELGSSFTQVAVCAFAVCLAIGIKWKIIGNGIVRIMPYILITMTTVMLFYAVSTQEKFGLVDQEYDTMEGRLNAKLFNDRGTVWKEGIQEAKTSPYFIKDLRVFIDMNAVVGRDEQGRYIRGYGLKLLPHNQVLYLLGRDGWWLGLVLCIFMWWMHIRAVNKATKFGDDPVFMIYFIPVSMGLFHILGLTGQSTCSASFQTHGFESTIVCGIIYGAITERERLMRMYVRKR